MLHEDTYKKEIDKLRVEMEVLKANSITPTHPANSPVNQQARDMPTKSIFEDVEVVTILSASEEETKDESVIKLDDKLREKLQAEMNPIFKANIEWMFVI